VRPFSDVLLHCCVHSCPAQFQIQSQAFVRAVCPRSDVSSLP
jgi:hypothetical protein